jgi:hypothetical protein
VASSVPTHSAASYSRYESIEQWRGASTKFQIRKIRSKMISMVESENEKVIAGRESDPADAKGFKDNQL